MLLKIFSFLVIVSIGLAVSDQGGLPWVLNNPFLGETNYPINVQTSTAEPYACPPLQFVIKGSDRVVVQNKAFTVTVTLNQSNTQTTLSSGPLGNLVFKFVKLNFIFNNNFRRGNGIVGSPSGGPPLAVEMIFFNTEYGSYENSTRFRNGIAKALTLIAVQGNMDNRNYTDFGNVLNAVKYADTIRYTTLNVTINWFIQTFNNDLLWYYAYPGSEYNFETGEQYYCATVLQSQSSLYSYISIKQYASFTNLLNRQNQPINGVLSTYAQSMKQSVIQGQGSRIRVD